MIVTARSPATLFDQAAAVLHTNDRGRWTKAALRLYPHQWSWHSAFIAIADLAGAGQMARDQLAAWHDRLHP